MPLPIKPLKTKNKTIKLSNDTYQFIIDLLIWTMQNDRNKATREDCERILKEFEQ